MTPTIAATTVTSSAVVACTDAGRSAADGSPSGAGGNSRDGGKGAELTPAVSVPCLVCGGAAEPGDDLCRSHGGFEDGIERHAAMRAVA